MKEFSSLKVSAPLMTILCIYTVLSGPLLSIDTFFRTRWFHKQTRTLRHQCTEDPLLLNWCCQTNAFTRPCITKTCLYNFDPIKPHFYVVKLGVYRGNIICHISAQNIDCGYSLEPPRRGGSNEYPQSMFWAEIWKILEFFIWKFSFFGRKIFNIFE